MLDPITTMLTIGGRPSDPIAEPEVGRDGELVLDDGEDVLHSDMHAVRLDTLHLVTGRRGRRAKWQLIFQPRTSARVELTTHRLLLAWPDWRRDSAVGSLYERRIMAPMFERDLGRQLLGGHVRHQWIEDVFVSRPKGRGHRGVRVDVRAGDQLYGITIEGFDADAGEAVVEKFIRAMAERRLELPELFDDDRAALRDLAVAPEPADASWAWRYRMPGAVPFGAAGADRTTR